MTGNRHKVHCFVTSHPHLISLFEDYVCGLVLCICMHEKKTVIYQSAHVCVCKSSSSKSPTEVNAISSGLIRTLNKLNSNKSLPDVE